MTIILYLLLLLLILFSYGFVDPNMVLFNSHFITNLQKNLSEFLFSHRFLFMSLYILIIVGMFTLYLLFLRKFTSKKIKVFLPAFLLLLLSYPAFSYDIFNYIATAKIAFFYHENPYVLMPIEISNEPMLTFLHASNKTALYGPFWILLSAVPYFLGLQNLFLTVISFKTFMALFYLLTLLFIYRISQKNIQAVLFFAFNPLVLIETLVSGHNDLAMMTFALATLYYLKNKKILLSSLCLLISILIKYATIFLFPIYLYLIYKTFKKQPINWDKIWIWPVISMLVIFLLSPLRAEMYPWYFIWVLPFIALLKTNTYIKSISIALSFGLCLHFAPYIYYYWDWEKVANYKIILTILPPLLFTGYLLIKNIKYKKTPSLL